MRSFIQRVSAASSLSLAGRLPAAVMLASFVLPSFPSEPQSHSCELFFASAQKLERLAAN
ncbi:MAG: hypothetical protein AB1651_06515 [Pseudomonadota bacterium]